MISLSQCFESFNFLKSMRVLSNINYKFCYYCFFYLLSFEERKIFRMNRRTEKYCKYFEINLDDCLDTEIFKIFSFN